MNTIERRSEPHDVGAPYPATVLIELNIGLKRSLWSEITRPCAVCTAFTQRATSGNPCPNVNSESCNRIVDTGRKAGGAIGDSVAESQILKPKAVHIIASAEIVAKSM